MDIDFDSLADKAAAARENAYAPYSGFKVGAALLARSGKIFIGCNIENAAYSPSVCAERVAVYNAVSRGENDFVAIAVAGWKDGAPGFAFPCGVCRQVLREFCEPDCFAVCVTDGANKKINTLSDLLPESFGPNNLI